uniref:SFRICE_037022 n=1 Tax=Spodoptera frugiperda TaxID=7108 RepID=A0A2H1WQC2_SPOFR
MLIEVYTEFRDTRRADCYAATDEYDPLAWLAWFSHCRAKGSLPFFHSYLCRAFCDQSLLRDEYSMTVVGNHRVLSVAVRYSVQFVRKRKCFAAYFVFLGSCVMLHWCMPASIESGSTVNASSNI